MIFDNYARRELIFMAECILCLVKTDKKGDANLVEGKRNFNAAAEIKNLNFVVRPISRHICRNCLNFLKQRANQRTKLNEINSKLLLNYREIAQEKGFTVKLKSSAKRLEYGEVCNSTLKLKNRVLINRMIKRILRLQCVSLEVFQVQ